MPDGIFIVGFGSTECPEGPCDPCDNGDEPDPETNPCPDFEIEGGIYEELREAANDEGSPKVAWGLGAIFERILGDTIPYRSYAYDIGISSTLVRGIVTPAIYRLYVGGHLVYETTDRPPDAEAEVTLPVGIWGTVKETWERTGDIYPLAIGDDYEPPGGSGTPPPDNTDQYAWVVWNGGAWTDNSCANRQKAKVRWLGTVSGGYPLVTVFVNPNCAGVSVWDGGPETGRTFKYLGGGAISGTGLFPDYGSGTLSSTNGPPSPMFWDLDGWVPANAAPVLVTLNNRTLRGFDFEMKLDGVSAYSTTIPAGHDFITFTIPAEKGIVPGTDVSFWIDGVEIYSAVAVANTLLELEAAVPDDGEPIGTLIETLIRSLCEYPAP